MVAEFKHSGQGGGVKNRVHLNVQAVQIDGTVTQPMGVVVGTGAGVAIQHHPNDFSAVVAIMSPSLR